MKPVAIHTPANRGRRVGIMGKGRHGKGAARRYEVVTGDHRDFNTVEIDGEPRDDVESFFSRMETDIAEAVRTVVLDPSRFDGIDKEWIVWLMSCIGIRNPRLRGKMAGFIEDVNYKVLGLMMATPERYEAMNREIAAKSGQPVSEVPYETARKLISERAFTISMGNNFHVGQELRMLEEIHGLLMQRNWRMLHAPADTGGFVSTDHPVVLVWTDPKHVGMLGAGPGFGLMKSTVYFPLSPEIVLEGAFEPFDDPRSIIELSLEGVAITNNNLMAYAQRQIYAPHTRFRYMVRKCSNWVMSIGHRVLDDWPAPKR